MLKTFEKLPQAKQRTVLDAAAKVFARKGYFQAGVAEICNRANISNGALYKYFKNKEDLFETVLGRTTQLLREQSELMAGGEASIWARLEAIFGAVAPFIDRHRDYFVLYMDLGSPPVNRFAKKISDEMEGLSFRFWSGLIKGAKSSGDVRRGLDTRGAAYLLDNHLMLYAFSCVSEHYDRRFNQYFAPEGRRLTPEDKVRHIMKSLRQFLA